MIEPRVRVFDTRNRKAAMQIDKTSFLLLAGTFAAGGAGGYIAHERGLQLRPSAPPSSAMPPTGPAPASASAAPSVSAAAEPKVVAPPCDDNQGAPEACPPAPAPSDEGIACNVAAKRCVEYKQAFKLKPAEQSVACLRKLVGAERCDLYRANLCGHKALMAACHESPPASDSTTSATGAAALSESSAKLKAQCEAIVKGCAGSVPETTLADCYRTLSGMNELGRSNMVECMKKHCIDKGLFACAAVPPPPAR
jgi:hypothetical protein